MESELKEYIGQVIVIDTKSPYVYIGTLEKVEKYFFYLKDVDVHDQSESVTTKEKYILEALKYGVRANRYYTRVKIEEIISISKIEDIINY